MARKPGLQLKIASADFLPKRLPAKPDSVREMLLGRLVGEARSVFLVPNPTDATLPPFEGIGGAFEFTDAEDPDRILQSPKLWVPDMIAEPVKNLLRDPETGEVRAQSVEIAFDIYAIRSTAPLGYTWKAVPVFEPTEADPHDPIARIKARAAQAALPAPAAKVEDAPEAEKEPVAAKHKGK
jgi:hypothetical protein